MEILRFSMSIHLEKGNMWYVNNMAIFHACDSFTNALLIRSLMLIPILRGTIRKMLGCWQLALTHVLFLDLALIVDVSQDEPETE